MGRIIVWNTNGDNDYSQEPNNFYIGRTKSNSSPLANPYTFNGKRSNIAKLSFKTREEALSAYKLYFTYHRNAGSRVRRLERPREPRLLPR